MAEDLTIEEAQLPLPITVRIRDACRLTGIGRSKVYELIAAGEIEIIKVGTITLVPMVSLTRFLERRLTRNKPLTAGGSNAPIAVIRAARSHTSKQTLVHVLSQ